MCVVSVYIISVWGFNPNNHYPLAVSIHRWIMSLYRALPRVYENGPPCIRSCIYVTLARDFRVALVGGCRQRLPPEAVEAFSFCPSLGARRSANGRVI